MSNHIYPQTDEVQKDRLDKIIQKAKDLPIEEKKALFERLEFHIKGVFDTTDVTGLKIALSEAFTNFEHELVKFKDQDAAEGFLHWNHLIFYKFYLKLNPTDSVYDFLNDALQESKYWLTDQKYSKGVLTKPFSK